MPKRVVDTGRPVAGPYSHAAAAGGWVYVSGQLPVDPETGEMAAEPIEAAAELALENLKGVIESAGGTLADAVKVTVYLADMGDFPKVNEVYAKYFPADPPARACVQVGALPLGAPLEIEMVAYLGGSAGA